MKRIISLMLCAVMVTAYLSAPCFAAEAEFTEEKQAVSDVGLWDSVYESGEYVTRAMLAKAAVELYNPYFAASEITETYFADVDGDTLYAPYINEAVRLGYMAGIDEKNFEPNGTPSVEQAVTVMVRALGYAPIMRNNGGYSAEYISISQSKAFLKGISGRIYQKLTPDVLAKLIYNSFEAELADVTTQNSLITTEKRTSLSLRDMYIGRGVVSGNARTSLDGSGAGSGRVEIDGVEYYQGKTDADRYIGHRVDFIYSMTKGSDECTLLSVYNTEKNNTVFVLKAEDIESFIFTDRRYTYDAGSGRQKTVSFSKTADIIYNGKASAVSAEEFVPRSGSVQLIDNNKDGKYEVVIIDSFVQVFVSRVDAASGRIYDKDYPDRVIDLKLSDAAAEYSLTDKYGKSRKLFEVQTNSVVSAAQSKDGGYIRVIISNDTASGIVQSIDIVEKIMVIGGKEYLMAERMNASPGVRVGENVTVYLDCEGKIAAIDAASDELNFAYLISYKNDETEENNGVMKLFTDKREFVKLNVGDKIKINRETYKNKSFDAVYNIISGGGKINRLIEYSANEQGYITEINTVESMTRIGYLATHAQGGLANGITGSLKYYKNEKSFSYRVYLKNSTRIFFIPYSDLENEEAYNCISADALENSYENVIEAYNMDRDNRYADVIMCDARVGSTVYGSSSPMGVIKSIKSGTDKYGDIATVMTVQGTNGEESVILANADANNPVFLSGGRVYGTTPAVTGEAVRRVELNRGDLIRYTPDMNGKITDAQIVFDCATRKFYSPTTNSAFGTSLRVTGGMVTDLSDGIITVKNADIYNKKYGGVAPYEFYPFGKCTTVAVDLSDSKVHIDTASNGDVMFGNGENSWYIMWTDTMKPMFAVVYNGLDKNPNVYLESEAGFDGYTDEKPHKGFVYPY